MLSHVIDTLSTWAIPVLVAFIPLYGWLKKIPIFDVFVEGAAEGFSMALKTLPFLVGILVALNIFEVSGALDAVIHMLAKPLSYVGVPAAVVPLILVRPLSGGAAMGIVTNILGRYGPDSFIGKLASTLQGSTDTTFYVLTLYFGTVSIRKTRYALAVALIGDLAGFVAAVALSHWLYH
ncbi:MAG: spore maturation protein [Firmicutes bacterium]|nr:spore maturation protein [Bacillota bacterium]